LAGEHAVVSHGVEQDERLLEIGFGFAWEADDDVSGEADVAACGLHPRNTLEILLTSVEALHSIEATSRATLHRQMHVVAERGHGVNGSNDVAAEVARV